MLQQASRKPRNAWARRNVEHLRGAFLGLGWSWLFEGHLPWDGKEHRKVRQPPCTGIEAASAQALGIMLPREEQMQQCTRATRAR